MYISYCYCGNDDEDFCGEALLPGSLAWRFRTWALPSVEWRPEPDAGLAASVIADTLVVSLSLDVQTFYMEMIMPTSEGCLNGSNGHVMLYRHLELP